MARSSKYVKGLSTSDYVNLLFAKWIIVCETEPGLDRRRETCVRLFSIRQINLFAKNSWFLAAENFIVRHKIEQKRKIFLWVKAWEEKSIKSFKILPDNPAVLAEAMIETICVMMLHKYMELRWRSISAVCVRRKTHRVLLRGIFSSVYFGLQNTRIE